MYPSWRIRLVCPKGHVVVSEKEPLLDTDGHYVVPVPPTCPLCKEGGPPKGPSERAINRELRRFRKAMKQPSHRWWEGRESP